MYIRKLAIIVFLVVFASPVLIQNVIANTKFVKMLEKTHNNAQIQLFAESEIKDSTQRIIVSILKNDLTYSVQEFLKFKNEPYLSKDIFLICEQDTLQPIITTCERVYEAAKEINYLMVFKRQLTPCVNKTFIINNFFSIGDTLVVKM